MKTITSPPRWRIVCDDGTGIGMRVFTPEGEEVTKQIRAVRWEVGPHPKTIATCTLELLAVEADVQVEKSEIARFAYCREHGGMVPVDEENRHVETLEESVERVFAPELRPGMEASALKSDVAASVRRCAGHRCGRTDADFPGGGKWVEVEAGRLLCPLCGEEGQLR